MKTTLNLDPDLMALAKRRALEEGWTLTRLVEDSLRAFLAPRAAPSKKYRLRLLTRRGRVIPGVDFADRDSLYERMEGRG